MENQEFFAGLFDFSFDNFIALKVIKVLYALLIISYVIMSLGGIIAGCSDLVNHQPLEGIAIIILSPIISLILIFFTRIFMEMMAVVFKIAENIRELVNLNSQQFSWIQELVKQSKEAKSS